LWFILILAIKPLPLLTLLAVDLLLREPLVLLLPLRR
jgi:hypothetical protein